MRHGTSEFSIDLLNTDRPGEVGPAGPSCSNKKKATGCPVASLNLGRLRQGVADAVEGVGELLADKRDGGDDDDGDEGGDEAVLDCGSTVFVADKGKHNRLQSVFGVRPRGLTARAPSVWMVSKLLSTECLNIGLTWGLSAYRQRISGPLKNFDSAVVNHKSGGARAGLGRIFRVPRARLRDGRKEFGCRVQIDL